MSNKGSEPLFLTPGPSELIDNAVVNIQTSFGRGDDRFNEVNSKVERFLLKLSGQNQLVSVQGSGSLANQLIAENFLYGNVLVLDTGFYSERLRDMALASRNVISVAYHTESDIPHAQYDWLFATPVETGLGMLVPISRLRQIADRIRGRLALDAVASIGLEIGHEEADVVAFSSCKGLFGLTGACFVASKSSPEALASQFSLSYETHKLKRVTGPYNQIQSISGIVDDHSKILESVKENKKILISEFENALVFPIDSQPLITTAIYGQFSSSIEIVKYHPRVTLPGVSIISSLGYLRYWSEGANPYRALALGQKDET